MANSKIVIRNRQISDASSRYLETWSEDQFIGNGWDLVVEDDGIHCVSEREYSDGTHTMLVDIDWHGLLVQRLITPQKDIVVKRKWVMPKGQVFDSCVLGLSGGYVDGRYVYFRSMSFQDFLDRTGLTAVKHSDPNGSVTAYYSTDILGNTRYLKVKSDGEVAKHPDPFNEERDVFEITGATWFIEETYTKESIKDQRMEFRKASILHTQVYPCEQLEAAITAAEWVR